MWKPKQRQRDDRLIHAEPKLHLTAHNSDAEQAARADGSVTAITPAARRLVPIKQEQWTPEVCQALWLDTEVRVRVHKARRRGPAVLNLPVRLSKHYRLCAENTNMSEFQQNQWPNVAAGSRRGAASLPCSARAAEAGERSCAPVSLRPPRNGPCYAVCSVPCSALCG